MNQRPQGLKVEKAMAGFLQYKSAEGLAPVTVTGYERDLKLWIEHMGDIIFFHHKNSQIQVWLFFFTATLRGGGGL